MKVPHDPDAFFADYLPESFRPLRARLGDATSPGAVVFRVGERPPLAVRIVGGALESAPAVPHDTIVQVSLAEADFEPILVRGAELVLEGAGDADHQLAVLRALTLDAERVASIRAVEGSVAFALTDDAGGAATATLERRVTLTPGNRPPKAAAECTVRCSLADFLAVQRGAVNPFELLMNGKIQLSGDAQIAMVLSSLLV